MKQSMFSEDCIMELSLSEGVSWMKNLDDCVLFLYVAGLPAEQTDWLQSVQNSTARLVLKKQKLRLYNDGWILANEDFRIIPLLDKLHWLPVKFHCKYEIATLACCPFNGSLPSYLLAPLCTYLTSRTLSSWSEKLLKIPKCSLNSLVNAVSVSLLYCLEFNACQSAQSPHAIWVQISAQNFPVFDRSSQRFRWFTFVCAWIMHELWRKLVAKSSVVPQRPSWLKDRWWWWIMSVLCMNGVQVHWVFILQRDLH